jgi:glycosyltransferase involved in cell wall biosynthesis
LGANPEKIQIIPNGINYKNITTPLKEPNPYKKAKKYTIGLVGRVVPIKDIKTFIKAMAYVKNQIDDFEVLIMGPTDEEISYYEECKTLVELLDLHDIISFTGKVNVKDYYPALDILVLSSISEGQPLVILEGYCFKVPTIATDVGSCHELIYGTKGADKMLGKAGETVPFGDPTALGEKICQTLKDQKVLNTMGENGLKRLKGYYLEEYTMNKYINIYNQFLSS